ncbi:hypothetical protein SBADM41S_03730 [Streptomyces badius]
MYVWPRGRSMVMLPLSLTVSTRSGTEVKPSRISPLSARAITEGPDIRSARTSPLSLFSFSVPLASRTLISPLSDDRSSALSKPLALTVPLSEAAVTATPRGTFTRCRESQLPMPSHFTRSVRVSSSILQTASGPLPNTAHPSNCRSTSTCSTSAGTRSTRPFSASTVSVFPFSANDLRSTGAPSTSVLPHPVRASASNATPPPRARARPAAPPRRAPERVRVGALVTMSTVIGPPVRAVPAAGRCHRTSLPVHSNRMQRQPPAGSGRLPSWGWGYPPVPNGL